MRSGNLKHKIDIQEPIETKNSFGEIESTWQTFVIAYASIVPISGKEYFSSSRLNSEVTHKLEIRYTQNILPKMRVSYGERVFNIESVINIREERKTIQLMCIEVILWVP